MNSVSKAQYPNTETAQSAQNVYMKHVQHKEME